MQAVEWKEGVRGRRKGENVVLANSAEKRELKKEAQKKKQDNKGKRLAAWLLFVLFFRRNACGLSLSSLCPLILSCRLQL